jgi:hypothetical protein
VHWVAGAVVVALLLVIWWLVVRGRAYRRVFADEHIVEFARAIAGLKRAAIAGVEEGELGAPLGSDDRRQVLTDGGLLLCYTISRQGEEYHHHLSLSMAGRYTPAAVGRCFVAYAGLLLGVPPGVLAVGRSENSYFHAQFGLAAEGQAEFERAEVQVPPPAAAAQVQAECFRAGEQLRVESINVGAMMRRGSSGS